MSAPSKYPGFSHDHRADNPFKGLLAGLLNASWLPVKGIQQEAVSVDSILMQSYPSLLGKPWSTSHVFLPVGSAARSKAAHPVGPATLGFLPVNVQQLGSPKSRASFLQETDSCASLAASAGSQEPGAPDYPFRPHHPRLLHSPDCPSLLWAAARHQLLGV